MRRLILVVCLLAPACTSALPAPTAVVTPTAAPPAVSPSTRIVALGNGMAMDVPLRWTVTEGRFINKATRQLLVAANGEVSGITTRPGNGDFSAPALPTGRVIVEIESICSLACAGPIDETAMPLDWSAAVPSPDDAPGKGHRELQLGFRWFEQSLFFVAMWSEDAPVADIAAIAEVARSLRLDPAPPLVGEYRGWDGLGPLTAIPVGTVRLEPLPTGAIIRPPFRTWDNEPFFIVRDLQRVFAFSSKPLVDRRCIVSFDLPSSQFRCVVDGRTFAWTRLGKYLGPEPASDMQPLDVIVRDRSVWVAYSN